MSYFNKFCHQPSNIYSGYSNARYTCWHAAALGGMPAIQVPTEGVQKETRPNKKSKWDKVFNPLTKPFLSSF
jgi:hypothetical protein